jgi:superfamily II DNA or RNA helicase
MGCSQTLIKDSAIRIPVDSNKDKEWFARIIRDLTRQSRSYQQTADSDAPNVDIRKYYDTDKSTRELMIPRFYELPAMFQITDRSIVGKDISITSKVVPRNERQKESIKWFETNTNGILCLSPGEGKTVVSIHSICTIGKKSIIFVHKDSLASQWVDKFLEHTDISEDNISRLRSSSFEEDLQKDIIITTVQTFCSLVKRKPPELMKKVLNDAQIGIAIWDECHTSVSAEQFSRTSIWIPSKRIYGLSATPSRLDGNTDIIYKHLGQVYVPVSSGIDTMAPKVILLKFDHGVMKNHKNYITHLTKYDRDNNIKPFFDTARYLSLLVKSEPYKKAIKKLVMEVSKSTRHLLFLADRIKILDHASQACKNKEEVGFFIPRSKNERDAHLQRRLVFSTYGSARDGTNKEILDCLILATPVSNLEQAVGRVVRSHPDKQQPVVIDLVDIGDDNLINRAKYRIGFYTEKNWQIEEKILK